MTKEPQFVMINGTVARRTNLKKYCIFLKDFTDKEKGELVWQKREKYLITHEDKDNIYFGKPITSGISKQLKGEYFVTEKDYLDEED